LKLLDSSSCASRARSGTLVLAVVVALLGAAPASAHPRSPTIALDFRLRLESALNGVHVQLPDGGRWIRIAVDRPHVLIVRGSLGEPVLRFAHDGVWVNTASPTAAADRIGGGSTSARGWRKLTGGRAYTWHDHRLTPPPVSSPGFAGKFSLPVVLDGKRTAIVGGFWRARRPSLALWLGVAAAAALALALVARALAARTRLSLAAVLAATGAVAGLAMETAFAVANPFGSHTRWAEVAAAAVLVAAVVTALVLRTTVGRRWVALVVGIYAALMGLDAATTLWHGAVVSSWPAPAVRAAAVAAFVCGGIAATLAFLSDVDERHAGRSG